MDKKSLSIIVVSYNTREILKECISSVISTVKNLSYEIIVVDNASTDGSVDMLQEKFSSVKVIANNFNKGFAAASNQAVENAQAETYLFLNPDTIVLEGAIEKLYAFLREKDDAGIAGPKLYKNANLEYHPSVRKFTRPLYVFISFLPLTGKILSVYGNYVFKKDKVHKPDWLWGAVLMVKKEVFDRAGGFDENYFLYSEEEDLCRKVRAAGYEVYYYPQAEIIHLKGQSSRQNKKESSRHFWSSRLYYFSKYSSPMSVTLFRVYFGWLLRVKMLLGFLPRDDNQREILKILK
jgi:hypothetical protein